MAYTFGSTESDDIGPAATTPVVVYGTVYTATFPYGIDEDARYVKDSTFYALGSDDENDGSQNDGNGSDDDSRC